MEQLLSIARKSAEHAEVYHHATLHDDVGFENGKLKDIDSKRLSGIALRIVKDGKLGFAYTRNLIDREGLVRNALATLQGGVAADWEFPLTREVAQLATYNPAIESLTNTRLVEESARVCGLLGERTRTQVNSSCGRTTHELRILNSRGTDLAARFSTYYVFASAIFPGSFASISRLLVSTGFEQFPDRMLDFIADTYQRATAEKTCPGGRMKVMFLPDTLYALIWRLSEATNAKAFFEKTSPVRDKIGQKIFSDRLTIANEPLDRNRPDARAFDDEGVACRNLPLVEAGILKNCYADLNYARKLGIAPTGNGARGDITSRVAPALEHLAIRPGDKSLAEMIRMIDRGIIVAGVMGAHSGNILNGDYSIGLSPGLLVENGEITGRVKDIMVAGNIYETMGNVLALEDQVYDCFMGRFPAILFNDVSVAVKS